MSEDELAEERRRFVDYLRRAFGDGALGSIDEPEGVQTGERVLYRLAAGGQAPRREPSNEALQEFRRQVAEVAARTGAMSVRFEPPSTSGLTCPRLIDLPGSSIIWDAELRAYAQSDKPTPTEDFPLEWAVGVVQGSDDVFLYLNFTHPRIKAVFTLSFDPPPGSGDRARRLESLREFRRQEDDLRRRVDADRTVAWARIVQVNTDMPRVRIARSG